MSRTGRRLIFIVTVALTVGVIILLLVLAVRKPEQIVDGPTFNPIVATRIWATVAAKTQSAEFEQAVSATAAAKTQAAGR